MKIDNKIEVNLLFLKFILVKLYHTKNTIFNYSNIFLYKSNYNLQLCNLYRANKSF